MIKNLKKYSLARDYFIIFGIIIVAIISLSVWYTNTVYNSRIEIKQHALIKQTNQAARELTYSFDYVVHLMKFMGEKILEGNPDDLKQIAKMLQGKLITGEAARKQFSWAMFDWSRKDKKIVATTSYGVLKKPIDVSHRNYAKMAPEKPWELHFDSADIGVTSGQWIIPAGMGISDSEGSFIGTISMGFNVNKLSSSISNVISSNEVSFVVLDQDNNVALHSEDYSLNYENKNFFQNNLPNNMSEVVNGTLKSPIQYGDIVYSYCRKIDGYPFTILIGYNKMISAKEFNEILFPGIIGYSVIGIIALLLLFILRILIIKPVIILSEAADKISRGEKINRIRGGRLYETRNLAIQILKVQKLLKKEQQTKIKHEKLLKIIHDSEIERESFIRDMNNALREPLNAITNGAQVIRQEMLGPISISQYSKYLDAMYDAGKQLETYTADFLYPTEVNIADVMEKCVTIKRRHAVESKQQLLLQVEKNIPNINADRLRLRQVVLSTIFHSISYTMQNGVVKIDVSYLQSKTKNITDKLTITMQDNGLGLNEEERNGFWKTRSSDPSSYNRNPDMDRLSLPIIRHLVQLHHGTFEVNAVNKQGTTFVITLPYLEKEILEQPVDLVKGGINPSNVLLFPKNKD